jgi:hypothetical protein
MYQSENKPSEAMHPQGMKTCTQPRGRVTPLDYRLSSKDWLGQPHPCERHIAFNAFVKLPLDAEVTTMRVVSRMYPADDERLLQATLDEDEKAAKRAYVKSPDGYLFNPRFAGVSGKKFNRQRAQHVRARCRKPGRYTALFFLLLECACAPEALLKLDWDDIDLNTGTVFLQMGNSETFRPAAISGFLCEVLSLLPRDGPRISDLGPRQLRRLWQRISKRADLGFLTLEELQAEGAWRQLEAMRAASFINRMPHPEQDATPGSAAIDGAATLQTELFWFESHEHRRGRGTSWLEGALS